MKKLLGLVISLVIFFSLVLAVSAQGFPEIPEKNGDYQDPGHPGVRVRVFVHEPKEKPGSSVSAVCTADPNTFVSTVGATGWKLPSTNWTYRINPSSVPSSVGGANLGTIASSGFNAWTNSISSSSKPTLVPSDTTNKTKSAYDGQNIIAWGRTSGNALAVTYTRYYTSTGLVVDVDTIMNLKFPWTLNTCSVNAYDAADILTHEQGHWFGLNDEYASGYVDDTMYGYGSKAETKKITPESGDKTGINAIYH